jgi:hypothetical protein
VLVDGAVLLERVELRSEMLSVALVAPLEAVADLGPDGVRGVVVRVDVRVEVRRDAALRMRAAALLSARRSALALSSVSSGAGDDEPPCPRSSPRCSAGGVVVVLMTACQMSSALSVRVMSAFQMV